MTLSWLGAAGLTLGFLILVSVLLWFLIGSRGRWTAKFVLIGAAVWYGIALFYSARQLMGWPSPEAVPPHSQVIAMRIEEPDPQANHSGAIYIWADLPSGESGAPDDPGTSRWHPRSLFETRHPTAPRAYKLPYDREVHRRLIRAQQQVKRMPGTRLRIKKPKDLSTAERASDSQERSPAPLELEIVNPVRLPPKE